MRVVIIVSKNTAAPVSATSQKYKKPAQYGHNCVAAPLKSTIFFNTINETRTLQKIQHLKNKGAQMRHDPPDKHFFHA